MRPSRSISLSRKPDFIPRSTITVAAVYDRRQTRSEADYFLVSRTNDFILRGTDVCGLLSFARLAGVVAGNFVILSHRQIHGRLFMNRTVFTAIGIFVLLCSTLHGQAPQLINYQGRVVVGTTNFNGTGRFKFALVNATNSSSTATAAADVISAGVIEHIKITTPGNGYTSPPTVTINDTGGGSGATATATVMFGRINKINISNGGSNYTGTTTVTIGPPPSNTNFTYWSNDGTSVNGSEPTNYVSIGVTNGLYSVLLGDTSLANMTAVSNFVAAYASADVRLRVWFDDGVHGSQLLSPDQRIGSVVYAFGASILGDPSTATDISTSGNQLNLEASGIIKLNTGGNMTGVNVTTSFSPSTGNHVLNIDSDLTTPGEVIADYIISAGAEFSAGISGT